MQMKKTFMVLLALVLLIGAVGAAGCLGGDDDNVTNQSNQSNQSNQTEPTTEPSQPANPEPAQPANPEPEPPAPSGETVTVQNTSEFDGTPKVLVIAKDRKFSANTVNISAGETVRIWNREDVNFAHLYHSEEGAFPDTKVNIKYDIYFTFNQPGTYKIDIYNPSTGEPYPTNAVLTVKVT
ncbi:hypothetical protein MsAg5_14330 [Methanosarcinaceae archaeon Ag5]|uniref:EfeO-type cupredoxin-like domain-containing protein n=1 Tax=Methanolapillus africanus TaxID=3028297 RepID=A0AAE4SEE5_9EURY|nr:hypothetical protein [Methanosarcinaceae archaeon Ag5]